MALKETGICPRGCGVELLRETSPTADWCYKCGHREYPGFDKRMGDRTGFHSQSNMTPAIKELRYKRVHGLTEKGYNSPEIIELTGYGRGIVERFYKQARTQIAKNLDSSGYGS